MTPHALLPGPAGTRYSLLVIIWRLLEDRDDWFNTDSNVIPSILVESQMAVGRFSLLPLLILKEPCR